jgi:hypothetical protein
MELGILGGLSLPKYCHSYKSYYATIITPVCDNGSGAQKKKAPPHQKFIYRENSRKMRPRASSQ